MERAVPDKLIDAIYDAALDVTALPGALELVGGQFRGVETRIVVWDLQTGRILPGISSHLPSVATPATARWTVAETSPMLSFAMRIPLHKAVDQAMQLGGPDSFKSLDIYADAYRPQRHMPMFGTVLIRDRHMLAGLSLYRPDHWPLADAADMALGESISRHVGRALQLGQLFARKPTLSSFEIALSAAPAPILLLNVTPEVVWTNAAAEELLLAGDGLTVRRRTLMTTNPGDDERLAKALVLAARGSNAALVIQRASAQYPLILRLLPLPRSQATAGARILVHVAEPGPHTGLHPTEVAEIFQLTPGEARVACEICADARTLSEVAETLQVSVNTVKTHLKRIYDKTGARSRMELAKLLAGSQRLARTVLE